MSSRFSGLPAIFQSFGSLSLMVFGIRRRQLGGRGRDLAVADRALARGVRDDAVGYGELADRHIPLVGRRLQQHHARRRAAAADIVLRGADAAAAAGAHLAPGALAREVAARRDAFGRHLAPVALQFFRDELGKAGERALPHLRARDADDAGVVGLDRDPDVDFGRGAPAPALRLTPNGTFNPSARPPPATAAEPTMNLRRESFVPFANDHIFHGCPPYALRPVVPAPAARCTAARMR